MAGYLDSKCGPSKEVAEMVMNMSLFWWFAVLPRCFSFSFFGGGQGFDKSICLKPAALARPR